MLPLSPLVQEQLPLYIRARNVLKDYIEREGLKPGDKLPSENDIARVLKVSRGTVRESLKLMEQEGLIISKQGLGTFVMEKKGEIQTGIEKLESVTNIIKGAGLNPGSRGIRVECIPADEIMAAKLHIETGEEVVRVFRQLTSKGKPLVCCQDVFPRRFMVDDIDDEEFGGSLMELFQKHFNIVISYAISYLYPVRAKGIVAQGLEIGEGCHVLFFENTHFTADDKPVLFSQDYFRDSFKFSLLRKREL